MMSLPVRPARYLLQSRFDIFCWKQHALMKTIVIQMKPHSTHRAWTASNFMVLSLMPYPFCHAVAETLRFIAVALHDVLRKTPSEALLFDNYARMCVILSEIINEVRHACCTQLL